MSARSHAEVLWERLKGATGVTHRHALLSLAGDRMDYGPSTASLDRRPTRRHGALSTEVIAW